MPGCACPTCSGRDSTGALAALNWKIIERNRKLAAEQEALLRERLAAEHVRGVARRTDHNSHLQVEQVLAKARSGRSELVMVKKPMISSPYGKSTLEVTPEWKPAELSARASALAPGPLTYVG